MGGAEVGQCPQREQPDRNVAVRQPMAAKHRQHLPDVTGAHLHPSGQQADRGAAANLMASPCDEPAAAGSARHESSAGTPRQFDPNSQA